MSGYHGWHFRFSKQTKKERKKKGKRIQKKEDEKERGNKGKRIKKKEGKKEREKKGRERYTL